MIRKFMFFNSLIMGLIALSTAFWLIGCVNDVVVDEVIDEDKEIGEVSMHLTGGFAGFSRTTAIKKEGESVIFAYTDHTANERKENAVAQESLDELWLELEANDVFTLSSNNTLLDTVRDGFFIEITVKRGEKYNEFSVYAPDLLVDSGETRYNAIVNVINALAEQLLPTAKEFTIADMPITDVTVEILESFPLQLHVVVEGYLSDSCTAFCEAVQWRSDNTVRVRITTKRPKEQMCATVITDIIVRVPLEGGFLPGRYKIIVNDVEKDIGI